MRLYLLAPSFAFALASACASSRPPPPPPASPQTPAPAPPPAPPPAAPSLSGVWLGTLHPGAAGSGLRLQLHLDLAKTPAECALDSLDQHAVGIPCTNPVVSAGSFSFDVPAVHGSFTGRVSADANTVDGAWSQGTSIPLVLARQAKAIEIAEVPPDPAMPPVELDKLQSVLDADLAGALASGALAPPTGAGIAIGVTLHGARRLLSYGAVKVDSVFEIGSISKTFTGLLLAQMVQQKKVKLDEPVRELLPKGTVSAPASGPEITLLDLSDQHSGLPRLPDNLHPADEANPYADYDDKALFTFLASHGVGRPEKPPFLYSNLGVGLLGNALAHRAGSTYEALLKKEITGPLGMRDTAVALTPALQARFAAGHDASYAPAKPWDVGALVGAGGIRSTTADMLTYLEAQLHPDHLAPATRATAEGKTLPAAIAASHEIHAEAEEGLHIALGWVRTDETGTMWHNGATGGYSAVALFNPEKDYAVVVLCNTSIGNDESFADKVGRHISQRLVGKPADALGPAPR